MLGTILSVLLSGFLVGALARWAVPGPDPMPVWLTVAFGLAGSALGGGVAAAFIGTTDLSRSDYFTIVVSEILATVLLLVLYRRVVQKRPITGPDARKPPTRGWGLRRVTPRSPFEPQQRPPGLSKQEVLRKLDELHDQGILTEEEYVEKRREVLRWE